MNTRDALPGFSFRIPQRALDAISAVAEKMSLLPNQPLFSGSSPATSPSSEVLNLKDAISEMKLLCGDEIDMSPEARGGMDPNQELLRTSGGLVTLAVLESFLHCGPEERKALHQRYVSLQQSGTLSFETFSNLAESHGRMIDSVTSRMPEEWPAEYKRNQALLLCTLVDIYSDLGKNRDAMKKIGDMSGDHDIDLRKFLRTADDAEIKSMFPSSKLLAPQLMPVLKSALLTDFNFGHILQGETCPAALAPLLEESGDMRSFVIHHHLRDISGARSHVDSQGSKILVEQKVADMLVFHDTAVSADDKRSLFDGFYDRKKFPATIEQFLQKKSADEARAVKLLALTARVEEYPERIEPFLEAWSALSNEERATHIEQHSRSGSENDRPFFIITYRPGFLDNLCKAYEHGSGEDLVRPLNLGLRALARIFDSCEQLKGSDEGLVALNLPRITVVGREYAGAGAESLARHLLDHPTESPGQYTFTSKIIPKAPVIIATPPQEGEF